EYATQDHRSVYGRIDAIMSAQITIHDEITADPRHTDRNVRTVLETDIRRIERAFYGKVRTVLVFDKQIAIQIQIPISLPRSIRIEARLRIIRLLQPLSHE